MSVSVFCPCSCPYSVHVHVRLCPCPCPSVSLPNCVPVSLCSSPYPSVFVCLGLWPCPECWLRVGATLMCLIHSWNSPDMKFTWSCAETDWTQPEGLGEGYLFTPNVEWRFYQSAKALKWSNTAVLEWQTQLVTLLSHWCTGRQILVRRWWTACRKW